MWKQNLKDEFGIHFKDCPEELQFLESFIEELLDQQKKELIEGFIRDMQECKNLIKRCPECGVEAENKMTYKEYFEANALWGRCFDCVSKENNTCVS